MRARSGRSAGSGVWDTLKLEWEVGLRRLPFFTQRLLVALLGLLVVSLALVGAMAILWGGPQRSDLPLRPPAQTPAPGGPKGPTGIEAPRPPHVRGLIQAPAGSRSSISSSTSSSSGSSTSAPRRQAGAPRPVAPRRGTTTTTTPPTSGGAPLTVPPVLSSLLK